MTLHVVKKKIIHSRNTEKCTGCYCAPSRFLLLDEEIIPPGAARSLAAKGSQLIPLWEFCSELPQLRLRPLLVKQENQSQRSYFNLDQLWRATPTPEPEMPEASVETSSVLLIPSQRLFPTRPQKLAHQFPSQSGPPQGSWIKSSSHHMGRALLWSRVGKLLLWKERRCFWLWWTPCCPSHLAALPF